MELPSLFQVAEHVVKDGFQGLHGVDDLLNVLSSISFGYRYKVGSEVALFVEFKLSPDYFQRSRSEVQMQIVIIVFVACSLHILLTTHLDYRSNALIKVSSTLLPSVGSIGTLHALIRALSRVVLVPGALSAGNSVNNVAERTLWADDASL